MKTLVAERLRCAACGVVVAINTALSWRCPNAGPRDRHHVLLIESGPVNGEFVADHSENPFVKFRELLAWDAFAASHRASPQERREFIEAVDAQVAAVAGVGFRITPFLRHEELSAALGFGVHGGVWVKDETQNVGGSHKARHLFTELLHLLFAEQRGLTTWKVGRPELAIASCGNAAIAASTLAASVGWPIRVFVPESADAVVMATLEALNANLEVCVRRASDPAGDPCVLRFRECVELGAIPFGVQGPENAWCLDGGRVIGWELLEQFNAPHDLSRIFIQVGGGAFAAGVGAALVAADKISVHLHGVQTEGCSPLQRAWAKASITGGTLHAGARWGTCMWPWESEPYSLADGILDDETYDWVSVCDAMTLTNGSPIVARETEIIHAYQMAHELTNIDVSPTGTAGLAGLLHMKATTGISPDENVAVVFSGVRRGVGRPVLR